MLPYYALALYEKSELFYHDQVGSIMIAPFLLNQNALSGDERGQSL